jgi:3D (Asp-Asp-Asp) domain-containing protein
MFKIKLTTIYFILSMLLTPVAYYQSFVKTDVPPVRVVVTATMYNAVNNQCDDDPFITAGMYKINPSKASQHKWVALSRNLLKRWGGDFEYGDIIHISGAGHKDGIYKVVDTMNKRFKNKIDFLETTGTKQYKFKNVTIQKVDV